MTKYSYRRNVLNVSQISRNKQAGNYTQDLMGWQRQNPAAIGKRNKRKTPSINQSSKKHGRERRPALAQARGRGSRVSRETKLSSWWARKKEQEDPGDRTQNKHHQIGAFRPITQTLFHRPTRSCRVSPPPFPSLQGPALQPRWLWLHLRDTALLYARGLAQIQAP